MLPWGHFAPCHCTLLEGPPGGAIRAQKVWERPFCSGSCEDWQLARGSTSTDVLKTQLRAEAEADGRPGRVPEGLKAAPRRWAISRGKCCTSTGLWSPLRASSLSFNAAPAKVLIIQSLDIARQPERCECPGPGRGGLEAEPQVCLLWVPVLRALLGYGSGAI